MQVSHICVVTFAMIAGFGSVITMVDAAIQPKKFVSKSYHFEVSYPSTWFEFRPSDLGVLNIISFPPAQRVQGVFIPRGGAQIGIRPADCGGGREPQWVKSIAQ